MKRARIEEVLKPLTGQHLSFFVLALDGSLGTSVESLFFPVSEVVQAFGEWVFGHEREG